MIKNLYHYLIIKKSGFFDKHYYLKNNQDVRNADINALWHFIQTGWKEGRNPSASFDVVSYLHNYPDVKLSGVNPLIHYIRHGKAEGRSLKPVIISENLPPLNQHVAIEQKPEIPIFNEQFPNQRTNKIVRDPLSGDLIIDFPEIKVMDYAESLQSTLKKYNNKISVIIPTKNAGDEFDILLKMLKNQEGFKEIEVVIVDSGSQDRTIQIAKNHNIKIIEIPSENFSHSYARNLGAKNASGDYLFFTVQDALPPSKIFLHTLLSKLKELNVSAISCAELPREDVDLFYRVISWNHYEFMEINHTDRILSMPSNPNYFSLRKNGQLSDLACLIPADIFSKFQYRFSYAEDLDIGLRLIKSGYKLAFVGSTRIIHSHNRDAFYFFKRGFVDNLFLAEIFDDFDVPKTNFIHSAQDIAFTYHFLNTNLFPKISEFNFPIELSTLQDNIMDILNSSRNFDYPKKLDITKNNNFDQQLSEFIEKIVSIAGLSKAGSAYDGMLVNSLIGFIRITFQYLAQSHEFVDKVLVRDLASCIMKEASLLFGANLAHVYLNQTEDLNKKYVSIFSKLQENV